MLAKIIEPAKAAYTLPAPTWRVTSVSSDGFNGFDLIQNVGEVSVFLTFDVNAKPITPLSRPNIVQDLSLRGIRVGAGIVLPSKSEEEQKRKISTCLKFPQRLYKGENKEMKSWPRKEMRKQKGHKVEVIKCYGK